MPQRFSIGSPSRKAYQAKIRAGKAAFNDADQAEAWHTSLGLLAEEVAPKLAHLKPAPVATAPWTKTTSSTARPPRAQTKRS